MLHSLTSEYSAMYIYRRWAWLEAISCVCSPLRRSVISENTDLALQQLALEFRFITDEIYRLWSLERVRPTIVAEGGRLVVHFLRQMIESED